MLDTVYLLFSVSNNIYCWQIVDDIPVTIYLHKSSVFYLGNYYYL